MKKEKTDRRIQRTRQLLSNALIELIEEQKYETITVQHIIDRANLGRSTFYSHYQSKEDLLYRGLDDIIHSLIWDVERSPKNDQENGIRQPLLSTAPLFRDIQEQRRLYRAILGGNGIELVRKKIHHHISVHIQEQIAQLLPVDHRCIASPAVIAYHMAGTLLTLLTWWLDNNRPYKPETMNEIFQELVMPGVWSVLKTTNAQR
ncbi:MAG: TetR/AcrR family transcriptional regulator [Candidatus Marinimicrobia bacterium]|nr:TetR/AcrR family transcriptional regulator [Candidatus Neomarinimicrobiota bacterium]